jgi:hypothetical protein
MLAPKSLTRNQLNRILKRKYRKLRRLAALRKALRVNKVKLNLVNISLN